MASIVKLPPQEVSHRLDAMFYRSDYVANAMRLRRSGVKSADLRSLVLAGRRTIYFSTDTKEADEADPTWIPFLTADDLSGDGCFINLNARRRVSPAFAARYPKGLLRANELLVKVKGPNQTTAYNADLPEFPVLISGTIWGALVRNDLVDPHYLVSALSSDYGAMARARLRTNTNVEFLGADDLLELLLPIPERGAQRYIGEKVRQAEGLRRLSSRLVDEVNTFHRGIFPSQDNLNTHASSRRLPVRRLKDRLDAHSYPAVVETYIEGLEGPATLANLCHAVFNGQTLVASDETSNSAQQATVASLSPNFVKCPFRLVARPRTRDKALQEHDLLLCNAAHTKDFIGRHITYCQEVAELFPSTEVMVLRPNRKLVPASYIRTYLQSKIGFIQIQATIRGITAHSYPSDIREIEIPIPRIAGAERERWFDCDARMSRAGRALDAAGTLTTAAKFLVEALIAAQVTEAELTAAQESLDRGDTAPDRAILTQLTRSGFAVPGTPLFPDLDALRSALTELAEDSTAT